MDSSTVELLTGRMPLYEKPGPRGVRYKFVSADDVVERLNQAFNHEWSTSVQEVIKEEDFIVVRIKLSVITNTGAIVSKEAFGGALTARKADNGKIVDLANTYKSAFSSALKKAAEQFGIGLKHEAEEEDEPKAPAVRKPAYSAPKPKAPEEPVVGDTVISVKTTAIEAGLISPAKEKTEAQKRAEDLLNAIDNEKPTSTKPAPVSPAPVAEKSVPAFPSAKAGEMITDIQKGAIEKLCAMAHKTMEEAMAGAVATGLLTVAKNLPDLSKLEGAAMIRYLSSHRSE